MAEVLWKPYADTRGCTFICFHIHQRFAFRLHYQLVRVLAENRKQMALGLRVLKYIGST